MPARMLDFSESVVFLTNKMQHHHLSRARLHHAAEYVIDAAPHAQLARKGGLALDEPAGFKRRRKLAQAHMRRVRKVAGHVRERLVRPDDLSGRCERHDGRKRRFRDRRTDLAALDLDVFHQLVHLLPPLRVAADRDKAQNYNGRHADQSVRSGKIQTDGRKCEKQHIKHRAAGSKRRLDFLFQIPAPLLDANIQHDYSISPGGCKAKRAKSFLYGILTQLAIVFRENKW